MATIQMGRVGACEEDIDEFVTFLCSSAASYVNGQTITVKGEAYMP